MDVTIADLRFERHRRVVLDIPSLHIREGRTTAILGPNGAGKTTLLRLIAALERPAHGRIVAAGASPTPDIRWRQHVAYVFQEEIFLQRSVRANLELGLRLRGLDRSQRTARIERSADLLGITHLLDRRTDRLSGGEARRVSLARALCLQASLVLLDEPLAGLDTPTYSRLLDELPRLLDAFGSTTVLVTHDRHEALRLGQDLVVLVDGEVQAAGEKRDVAVNPRRRAVAQILGYTILDAGGRSVAIPPGGLALGRGPLEFQMQVEDLLDLVHDREIVGRVGDTTVHVTVPYSATMPAPGDRVLIHANGACDVD
jgi:tungstate transport system ATP-binding protein